MAGIKNIHEDWINAHDCPLVAPMISEATKLSMILLKNRLFEL